MMSFDLLTVFGAGLLTLISPCVLPLIPIYLGMLLGSSLESVKEPGGRARLLTSTLAFAVGFGSVFTLLGLGASSAGQFLHAHRQTMLWVGGALIVLFGLKFLGVLRIPFLDGEKRFRTFKTGHRLVDAALFGVVFALGWTPCVGPILGSVLTYTASKTTDTWMGAAYLAAYSAGLALPLLGLSFASDRLLPLLRRLNRHIPTFEKITGAALIVVGLWLISSAAAVPSTNPDVPPGPAVASDGEQVSPWLGEATSRPRLVEFYTKSCPSCVKLEPRIAELRQNCMDGRLEVLQIDAGDPRNRQVVERYRISMVPTISLLAPDGREVRRLLGEQSIKQLRQAAASLIEESCAGEEALPLDDLSEQPETACREARPVDGGPDVERTDGPPLSWPASESCGG